MTTQLTRRQLTDGLINDAKVAADAAIALSKLATNPLARANHTGTQLASTISDFNSATDARIAAAGIDTKTLDMKDAARIYMSMDESTFDAGGFSTTQQSLTVADGDPIFIEVTDNGAKSGKYDATVSGATFEVDRSADFDATEEVTLGATVPIAAGTKAGWRYTLTNSGSVTVGTTVLTFVGYAPASAMAGDGTTITISGLTISIATGGVGTAQLADDAVTPAKLSFTFVDGEDLSATVDGVETDFDLANTPLTGSVTVYLNGQRLRAGASNDYTISGGTITMASAPESGDLILADYRY
jgi:hypothetical protein